MNTLVMAGALGAISGSRSMLAPALVARAMSTSPLAPILSLLAAGEIAADKLPSIPARTDALPLSGRVVSGAIVGASVGRGRRRVACALAGAAGAVAASYALVGLRRFAAERGLPNVVAGLLEDAAALAVGTFLLARR